MTWKEYFNERLICEIDGLYVIKPKECQESTPMVCELCKFLYRTKDDETAHEKFQCCFKCAMRWAHPNVQAWSNGWRPSQDEIGNDVKQRPMLSITID